MNRIAVAILATALAYGAHAHDGHFGASPDSAPPSQGNEFNTGEVRDVKVDAGVITIRHGVMDDLRMPPMTMEFRAADPAILELVMPGDKIGFRAGKAGDTLIVEEIELAR